MSATEKETPFELKTENNIQFSSKCKDIFGNLEKLEKKHEENTKFRTEDDVDIQKSDYLDVDTETITSAFKTPQLGRGSNREGGGPWRHRAQHRDRDPPPWREHCDRGEDRSADRGSSSIQRELQPKQFGGRRGGHPYYNSRGNRRQRTPDYKMNPEKWTKYSLEDVNNEDMTESSNTKAAFAFLEECRKLREGEMKVEAVNTDNTSCSKGIFTFKKPVKNENKKGKSSVSSKISNQLLNSKEDDISAGVGEEEDNKMEEKTEKVQEEKVKEKRKLGRGSNREGGGPWRHRAQHRDRDPPPWREHCDRGEDRSADRGSSSIQRELQPKQFGGRRGGHPYYNSI